ncbi:MBL fold metallo-hydrolase [candidate division KSB1 bacterium]|nr:MBL fold metallo-hydrolase [candidate division KSB1 bacterium]NIR72427.1 MBL fold metallo-hydrolase [candidate division KSB1 bacterium]NIS23592.1 MBL fold metallo-hydrolase [candidate division KSB1 bacterium]NIT70518.1 MBL fold metallo-hydrolase [candidate division KSB1 bacterium]NIU24226.1 MBL fold metallo-hydrolase [candidate division KSB1 bacterium]
MRFGEFELYTVSDGKFKLDGGAMFGVVPKVLWNKLNPADEQNRITLGLNCLLIKTNDDLILVDTGIGSNYDEKFANIFGIKKNTNLLQGLRELGYETEDVTKVIQTHLHFDHCGGCCIKSEAGQNRPTFPNATYFVQKGELEYAKNPDPRSKGSYLAHNWQPLEEHGQIELFSGDREIMPGIEVQVTGGHTRDHQIIKIHTGDKTACFLADLVPTDAHLKTPYVMGYDLYPKTTMEVKEKVLQQALKEEWLLIFEHAPSVTAGYLYESESKLNLEKIDLK